MPKRDSSLTPIPLPVLQLMEQWGRALRAQRQRSQIHMRDFAYRLNVSLDTLQRLERGEPSVQASTYLNAMLVLGMLDSLCVTPSMDMQESKVMRVRTSKEVKDDYF